MSASKEFNKARATFMRLASAPELPASVLKLAYLIAFTHMDSDSETARVGQKRLASDLSITVRAVQKLIVRLRRFGLQIETGKGPEQANVYRVGSPPAAENANCSSPISGGNTNYSSPIAAENTNWSDTKTRTGATENTNYSSPLLNKNLQEESPRVESDSRAGARASESPPDFASLDSKQGSAAGRRKPQAKPEPSSPEIAEAFSRFWAAYPRHDAKTEARKAFARVSVDTDPETIIAGAKLYALAEQLRLARPGQSRQHTAMAKNWLPARRYNDPPPPGAVIDESGNVVAIEDAPQPQSVMDVAAAVANAYRQRERP